MRNILIVLWCLCGVLSTQAQIEVPAIPDSLKENAHAVVVSHHTQFEVKDEAHASLNVSHTVCILDKYGKGAGHIYEYYDQFKKITELSAILYDANGEVIEKYKMKDFQDYAGDFSSVANSSRAKRLSLHNDQYPYYVSLKVNIDYQGILHFPRWFPQENQRISILQASLEVSSPKDNLIRHQELKVDSPTKREESGIAYTRWELSNKPAVLFETYSGNRAELLPSVMLAPSYFEMDGYSGEMKDWESYGKWIQQLNSGRNNLDPSQLSEIKSLVSTLTSKEEKVRAVYKYLQENTRYVSVQLGIGGWQPFETALVHEKKYGDCKALSFYTQAMLEAVGIPSHYTLISSGFHPKSLSEDFAHSHFNHAILTVPLEQDTVWLECTSQTNPFGYQGTFTSDRDAIIITDKGGKRIHTRRYSAAENIQTTHSILNLDKEGAAQVNIQRRYRGLEVDNDSFRGILLAEEQDQRNWFFDDLGWGSLTLNSYEFQTLTDEIVPEGGFNAEVEIPHAASKSGDRLFMKPFQFTDISYIKLPKGERKYPIKNYYAYTQLDSAEIIYPEAYHPEKGLEDVELTTDFGIYSRKAEIYGNRLLCIRKFVFNKGTYAPERYAEFRSFIRKVQKYDRQKLVLLGNT